VIPNIIHFCWPTQDYKGGPFSLMHEISVRSAFECNKPDSAFFHCESAPIGPNWDRVSHLLTVLPGRQPRHIFGRACKTPAHMADFMRLQALREFGGVYLDLDTVSRQSLATLRQRSTVFLGRQSSKSVCNAVLGAEKGSQFVDLWIETFRHYRGARWAFYAADVPTNLAECFAHLVTIEPQERFYPWSHVEMDSLFLHALEPPKGNFLLHLWGSHAWKPWLRDLTQDAVMQGDSTFCRAAKNFL
jgi:hypothetical protein